MASGSPSKRLVIFCDGTWCGRETQVPGAPESNIKILADMVGEVQFDDVPGKEPTKVHTIHPLRDNITAGYQEGVGLNKTFLEYLWDGATASTIGEECVSVYKFIVNHYTDDHEIWMFGLSRGAFTVRCVAGMINNCGIIKRARLSDEHVEILCQEVYRTYRSPLDIDHPSSDRCVKMRENAARVWPVSRPVRFMGLFDTVGSLGIPRVNAGIGFDWPEFYDQKVSSVVQDVYHAVSLHDRLWIFQPCLAFESDGDYKANIHQKWFPGVHYDLGRQTFRFVRQAPSNHIEKVLGALPDRLSKTIYPNQVLSDLVLRWMLQAVQSTDSSATIIPDIKGRIQDINKCLTSPPRSTTGSGDVYGNALDYGPTGSIFATLQKFGSRAVELLNKLWPQLGDNIQDLLGIKTILRILTATRDRRIPGNAADVYDYKEREQVVVEGVGSEFSIEGQARIEESGEGGAIRYPSRTFESFGVWRRVFGEAM